MEDRTREEYLSYSCERLLVGDTIGAKTEGREIAVVAKSALTVINEAGLAA
jgi:hypothetical protein